MVLGLGLGLVVVCGGTEKSGNRHSGVGAAVLSLLLTMPGHCRR
jgi:hypothetical protein